MELFGFYDHVLKTPLIVYDQDLSAITQSPNNSLVLTTFDKTQLKAYFEYHETLIVKVHNVLEFILLHKVLVKFSCCDLQLALELQNIADNYMSDTKVLAIVKEEQDITQCIQYHLDGVINAKYFTKA